MILGYQIQLGTIIIGGLALFMLVALTMLVGLRIIRFKGRRHLRVHKGLAWTTLAVGTLHGLLALTFFYGWKVLS
jgi:hypothetical protein